MQATKAELNDAYAKMKVAERAWENVQRDAQRILEDGERRFDEACRRWVEVRDAR